MKSIAANHLGIKLFDGSKADVEERMNEWFRNQPVSIAIVDIEYNYQGGENSYNPEHGAHWDPPTHGVLVVYDLGTSQREEKESC